jgi:DNA-binding CsgD family transcriptional regulator
MAACARPSYDWGFHVARIIDGIGRDTLSLRVLSALAALVDFEHTGLFVFQRACRPRDVLAPYLDGAFHRRYCGGTYKLDPFYKVAQETSAGGVFRMRELDPGYHRYLDGYEMGPGLADLGLAAPAGEDAVGQARSQLCEEIGYLLPIAGGRVVHIPLIRSMARCPFADDDIERLRGLASILQAAFDQHFRTLSDTDTTDDAGPGDDVLRRRLIAGLTPRELEVARRVAAGLTSAELGRQLGIARQTVKVHRKNVYRKLDVGSQAELARLLR